MRIKGMKWMRTAVAAILMAAPMIWAENAAPAPSGASLVAHSNNEFALEFYKRISAENKDANIFASPVSITTALAMTFEGAQGVTRQQMADVLHLKMSDQERQSGYAALMKALRPDAKNSYKLSMGNALWGQKDYSFLPAFTGAINQFYGGGFRTVDYVGAKAAALATINGWVEQKTENRIKNLVHDEDVNALTRLILTNAIYFKGDWKRRFQESMTQPGAFHLENGKSADAKLMHQRASFPYMHADGVAALEMPYVGDELSMLVLLPDGKLDALESKLTSAKIDAMRAQMESAEVDVKLPRFTFEQRYQLADTLNEMGMKDAFQEDAADFSGMTGRKGLYIAKVIHQSFIEVNEQGSEAAAATAVIMATKSMPSFDLVSFHADRPFVFMIVHKATGAILFLGRVQNPAA